MLDPIHGTFPPAGPPPPTPWRESNWFKSCSAAWPFVQGFATIALAITAAVFGYYLTQRDTNAQQVVSASELKREVEALKKTNEDRFQARNAQIAELDKKVLTKEVFDAYHKADAERMERIERMVEQILEKK